MTLSTDNPCGNHGVTCRPSRGPVGSPSPAWVAACRQVPTWRLIGPHMSRRTLPHGLRDIWVLSFPPSTGLSVDATRLVLPP